MMVDWQLQELIDNGTIDAPGSSIQPASVDLCLGNVAYRLLNSRLPFGTVRRMINKYSVQELSLDGPATLRKGSIYIIPLAATLSLPFTLECLASAKSSTGRAGILARVITNLGQYDFIPGGYKGRLYVELVPMAFDISVQAGISLIQLRAGGESPSVKSSISKAEILEENKRCPLVSGQPLALDREGNVVLSADLQGDTWVARASNDVTPLDLIKTRQNPNHYYDRRMNTFSGLQLEAHQLALISSMQTVRIPDDWAAEMVPYAPELGEMRAHFAGFFDPGFAGKAVMELAPWIPTCIRHGQPIAKLRFIRLEGTPEALYGSQGANHYQGQEVCLGKQFSGWLNR